MSFDSKLEEILFELEDIGEDEINSVVDKSENWTIYGVDPNARYRNDFRGDLRTRAKELIGELSK